jgi:predicted Zn-dependent protease with MMP-like domain
LFSGPNHEDTGTAEPSFETAQITLFTHCLWEAYGLDETSLLEEVRVTVLHEVGHYFGLNEDEVAALGLA